MENYQVGIASPLVRLAWGRVIFLLKLLTKFYAICRIGTPSLPESAMPKG